MSNSHDSGRLALPFADIDPVEVAPDRDHFCSTTALPAQLLMTVIGPIMHAKKG